ncbi:MAG: hypothetical protein WB755_14545 [Terriglobales bacterium]
MFGLIAASGLALFIIAGCDLPDRVSRLEKENQELKAEAAKNHAAASATVEFDLQAKCSRDAKAFFNEGWTRDKDTKLLTYTNHYNKAMNKCFLLAENHFALAFPGSWANDMTLWDVYENAKYGSFFEVNLNKPLPNSDKVDGCQLLDKKCTTLAEFNGLVWPYLNN